MSLLLTLVISICVSAGILLVLSRDLFRIIMGVALLGVAANLIVFLGAHPDSLVPAIMQAGQVQLSPDATSPLPQALVLTAIVIGFALFCFSILLAAALTKLHGHTDVSSYQDSEPPSKPGTKPTIMEVD